MSAPSESPTEAPTGAVHELHFRDARPPHEVQFALERELIVLFSIERANDELVFRSRALVNGATYDFELRFVAALAATNCYSLRTEASWAHQPPSSHAYFKSTFASWLQLWTRELTPAAPPAAHENSLERHRELVEAALRAEAHLDSVAAIQRAIVEGLRRGARFATSHKEGGTTITCHRDRFVRSDFGENPDRKEYADEPSFLAMLRQTFLSDVSRHAVTKPPPEFDAWKLILRRLIPH